MNTKQTKQAEHTWGKDGFCVYCHNIHQTDHNARSTCSDGFSCRAADFPSVEEQANYWKERDKHLDRTESAAQWFDSLDEAQRLAHTLERLLASRLFSIDFEINRTPGTEQTDLRDAIVAALAQWEKARKQP